MLIEWKYTESYSRTCLAISKRGTDKREIYRSLYDSPCCPIDKTMVPEFGDLFYEPFYQFLRQQLLAHEMEQAKGVGMQSCDGPAYGSGPQSRLPQGFLAWIAATRRLQHRGLERARETAGSISQRFHRSPVW